MKKLLIITRMGGQFLIPINNDNPDLENTFNRWLVSDNNIKTILFRNPEEPKVDIPNHTIINNTFCLRVEDVVQMNLLELSSLTLVGSLPKNLS